MPAMRRWIATLLLFALLPWQAVGWATTAIADDGIGAQHAIAHWSGEAHHHDGHDEGFHQDGSEESIQHAVHSDAHLNAVAVLTLGMGWALSAASSAAPGEFERGGLSSPFLEGPRRPPRSTC